MWYVVVFVYVIIGYFDKNKVFNLVYYIKCRKLKWVNYFVIIEK